mgnify:CR=1 FL=1
MHCCGKYPCFHASGIGPIVSISIFFITAHTLVSGIGPIVSVLGTLGRLFSRDIAAGRSSLPRTLRLSQPRVGGHSITGATNVVDRKRNPVGVHVFLASRSKGIFLIERFVPHLRGCRLITLFGFPSSLRQSSDACVLDSLRTGLHSTLGMARPYADPLVRPPTSVGVLEGLEKRERSYRLSS